MKKADIEDMKVKAGEYITVAEIAKILNLSLDVINKRIFRLGIKPLSRDALYEISILDKIRNVPGKGRPPKTNTAKTAKKK